MAVAKVAITIDQDLFREVDDFVQEGAFPNRSCAINAALVVLKEQRNRKSWLLAELAKLDPEEEKAMAEERFVAEAEWPEF